MESLKNVSWWWSIYKKIVEDIGINKKSDEEATIVAAKALQSYGKKFDKNLEKARKIIYGKSVAVIGAHESFLEQQIPEDVIIAADGSFNGLIYTGRIPQILVTDFDGANINLVKRYRPVVFAHVHGDNLKRYLESVPEVIETIVPTTQTYPFKPFYNFGGFTDGDRAVIIAIYLGASKVKVYGFNITQIGKFSGLTNPETKIKKIYWAYRIIELVKRINDVEVRFVESQRIR